MWGMQGRAQALRQGQRTCLRPDLAHSLHAILRPEALAEMRGHRGSDLRKVRCIGKSHSSRTSYSVLLLHPTRAPYPIPSLFGSCKS